ncbi:ABC transporter ATP-binding protein [Pseudomonas typographi]|uniref:ABC transporter ATP-binding protein n=1 Tax=Pseudomonas typographi TaxID=2715964 RepID=A0ABR7Z3B3_9PSED|nr:ABC transporter ATP-binding protein [Pseudomonas typographi]MBD1551925.1 ABC transporter ATP-binding protein [Pseudomonas typographi]MBD1599990.1 ABC transporter ATP-binding protein [Pseudomonas typographi]
MARFSILLPYLRPHRRSLSIAFGLMLCEALVELSYPLFMLQLIDRGVLTHDQRQVLLWGSSMVILALFSFACGITSTFYAADGGQSFARDLRAALFSRLAFAPLAAFQRLSTASLLTRLTSDTNQLQNAVFMCVRLYLRAPLIILGAVVLALAVDSTLAAVLALATPLIGFALSWTLGRGLRLFRLAQEQLDRLTSLLRENFNGMQLIRAYGRGEHEQLRFIGAAEALRRRATQAMQLSEMVVPALILLLNLCTLAILWGGSRRIMNHGISPGEVVAILNYTARIIGEFAFLSMILTNLSMARSALGRVSEVLDGETEAGLEEPPQRQPCAAPAVTSTHLGFAYPGQGQQVLRNVSFAVQPGHTAVILGATGSGKTSLLQLLARLHDTDEGQLCFDGQDIQGVPLATLRQRIGYVTQAPMLVSGSIADNLRWGKRDATLAELAEAAKKAQIHELILSLPDGYDTVLQAHGGNLSGGQKQRLCVARALLRQPDLLLLDDCTSALDAHTEAALLNVINGLPCTTLLVTQKISAARRADTVLLLEGGQLTAQGTHAELLEKSTVYRQIVESQSRNAGVALSA